jgi:hypothetical protein
MREAMVASCSFIGVRQILAFLVVAWWAFFAGEVLKAFLVLCRVPWVHRQGSSGFLPYRSVR